MTLKRVTVRCQVDTLCPHGGRDVNDVAITWSGDPFQRAESLRDLVLRWQGQTITCETLAESLAQTARTMIAAPVSVVVTQVEGHGVEVEAEA